MKKIIFCLTTMARTGAEVALINLIKHSVKYNKNAVIISQKKGDLATEIPSHIPIYDFESFYQKQTSQNLFQKLKNKITGKQVENYWDLFLGQVYQKYPEHIWYINTIWLAEILDFSVRKNLKTIQHLHSLQPLYTSISLIQLEQIISHPQLIITCSMAVLDIIHTPGRKKNIEVCYPAIKLNNKSDFSKVKLPIPKDYFVWLMSGSLNSNKNPLLFVELAHQLSQTYPKVYFIWLGGNLNTSIYKYLKAKIKEYQIDNKVLFTGALSSNYYEYFNLADAFILTSKEESFGIVTLEALALGKPVLGFDSVGINEILDGNEDIGRVCKSWNTEDMLTLMKKVMNKEIRFDTKKAKIRAAEFSIEKQLNNWENILDKYL